MRALIALLIALGLAGAAGAGTLHEERPVGVRLTAFDGLVTHGGAPFVGKTLRGAPAMLVFGYTRCAAICPTTLAELTLFLNDLGSPGERLKVLFVTADPARDTPERLAAYLGSFDRRIVGLTGSAEGVAEVARALGTSIDRAPGGGEDYSMKHPYSVFVLDRYGMLARQLPVEDRDGLADAVRRVLAQ